MINTAPNSLVFNVGGRELATRIRAALDVAANENLSVLDLKEVDLESVTTKTNLRAAFAKFTKGRTLKKADTYFDELYVSRCFDVYRADPRHVAKDAFDFIMAADTEGSYSYKRSYAAALKAGLGLFLIALHSSGAITLPATFLWPSMETSDRRRLEIGKNVASELLAFVRGLDTQSEALPHPAFEVVGGDRKRREWFLTYATKLLLATGWHKPEDANLEDLISIKQSERRFNSKHGMPFAYSALLDVLAVAFPGRVKVTSDEWANALAEGKWRNPSSGGARTEVSRALEQILKNGNRADQDLLAELIHIKPAWGKPSRVRSLARLPGLDVDLQAIAKLWLDLEDLYVSKVSRESYKVFYTAIGYWNIYLFYYLPYWFDRNPSFSRKYPSSPALLMKSVFVSRLLASREETPITFLEFMEILAERNEWRDNSFYATLLQLQVFFKFIEQYSDDIPGCEGFTQPIAQHDMPKSSRASHSNKKPLPRRFYGVYLDYHESLLTHLHVVLNRIVAGEISQQETRALIENGGVIDTFATSEVVGFVPVLFTKTKTIPLRFIPNVLDIRRQVLADGRTVLIPHPHALHQNLVALHTGLRHNHIQWLDRDTFDSGVEPSDTDFSVLLVNTDKQMTKPWTPNVSFRVIELLRAQRAWCQLIKGPKFHAQHYYNDNPKTKWAKLRPLFAYYKDGKPHSDDVYSDTWKAVLCGLQGLMSELTEFGKPSRLVTLLPPGFAPSDTELIRKLEEYGSTFTDVGDWCPLRPHTTTTPHSARVAVVSQYVTFLPTDLVGKYFTGQKPGTVAYYVHIDEETLDAEQAHQAARMRDSMLRQAFDPVLNGGSLAKGYVHADRVNSRLAQSMRASVPDTIAAHGGISITFSERGKNGVDVLLESGAADIAYNKTEICPYGNNCPAEIVKELKGLRRCSLCPFAVRFVDHLQAILAKQHQTAEAIDELEAVLATDEATLNSKFSSAELEELEAERARLCEDLTGWILSEERLELMRQRLARRSDGDVFTVQRPEILERDLRRVAVSTSASEYLLARLGECIAFPSLEGAQVRARFDLLRRELLARSGRLREAFAPRSVDPAVECAGLLRSIVITNGLSVGQVADLLESGIRTEQLPKTELRLLSGEDIA